MDTRRLFSIGLILLGVALGGLLGFTSVASAQTPSPQPQDQEIVVTALDDGGKVYLTAGQTLVVRLRANPSTGYGWHVAEPTGEEILRQTQEGEFQADSALLGVAATQVLRFEGVREGQTTLRLEYRRPWEPGEKPARTFQLEVQTAGPFGDSRPPQPQGDSGEMQSSASEVSSSELPPNFNWCDLDGCTPVKDQGQCGSCWAFGTVGSLELDLLIKGGLTADLSEQYLVSCNLDGWGCNGGWWAHDYHGWKVPKGDQGAGALLEAAFPYVASDVPCDPPHPHEYQIVSWHFVKDGWGVAPIVDIKKAIYEQGPVASAVCVSSAFQSYEGGVFEGPGCTIVNHAVVLVGWDDEQGDSGVWLLRNSWGSEWGDGGYMRIPYGLSSVGFGANYVVYVPSSCFSLTVERSPEEAGSVTLDPPPNCPRGQYEPGTEVQLVAGDSAGWHFTGWSGAAAGDRPSATVVMDSHKSVTAHFRSDLCPSLLLVPLGLAFCRFYQRRHPRAG